jgi:hypothetical protein
MEESEVEGEQEEVMDRRIEKTCRGSVRGEREEALACQAAALADLMV